MKTQRKRTGHIGVISLWAFLAILWAGDGHAMCLLRNRLRPGQTPLPWASQPTWRTLAGYPEVGGTNDGAGWMARFSAPSGITVGGSNGLLIADMYNSTIRRIGADGVVSTLAGLPGTSGYKDGPINVALFNWPNAVAADTNGNVFVADANGTVIRKISSLGIVSTLAGRALTNGYADDTGTDALFNAIGGLTFGRDGNLYVTDSANCLIRKITPAGVVSTFAGFPGAAGWQDGSGTNAWFYNPQGIAADDSGNLYVADTWNNAIRKITPGGLVSTLAGQPGTFDWRDETGTNAWFSYPSGVTLDAAGNVYVADMQNYCIRKISPAGDVSTIAGVPRNQGHDDGGSLVARFQNPVALALWGNHLVVADSAENTIRYGSLTAEAHPEFLTQPLNAILQPDSTATFQFSAKGSGALACQWFSGSFGSLGGLDGTGFAIPNATNTTLVLSNADPVWGYQAFRVAISDGFGYVLSLPVTWSAPGASSAGPFSHWHPLSHATPSMSSIAAVAHGNGRYVAVGTDISGIAASAASTDGIRWMEQSFGVSGPQFPLPGSGMLLQVNGVAFGNGTFVAVGSGGSVLTSTDGLSWTNHALTPLAAPTLQSIVFDQGLFVAVSSDDNGSLWSSADGISWTNIGFELERHFQKVIFGGGKFVAVGNSMQVSSNGLDWEPAQFPEISDSGLFDSVAYGNGVFVATQQPARGNYFSCGSVGLLVSPDGVNWADMTPTNGLSLSQVAFGNGQFVAWDSSSGEVTYSSDGINWTASAPLGDGTRYLPGGAVHLALGGGLFVAVGYDNLGNDTLFSSTDGASWMTPSDDGGRGVSVQPSALINVNGNYVGCDYTPEFIFSTNGLDWSFRPATNGYASLAYGEGVFVAVGSGPTKDAMAASTDGVTWAEQNFVGSASRPSLSGVAYGKNGFVAVGSDDQGGSSLTHMVTSTNGLNWKQAGPIVPGYFSQVAYGNGTYVAAAEMVSGMYPYYSNQVFILSSTNGSIWQRTFSNDTMTGFSPRALAFGNSEFVVEAFDLSNAPIVLTSPDGYTWTQHPLVGPYPGDPLLFVNGYFLQVSFNSSLDGLGWAQSSSSVGYANAVFAGEGVFLAYFYGPQGIPLGLYVSDPIERLGQANRLPGGRFQFTVTGARHLDYDVEASETLQNWQVIGTVSNSVPTQSFIDSGAPGHSKRFYRVVAH